MNHQKQTAAAKSAQRTAIADRRRQVAALALMRVPGEEIARQLTAQGAPVSTATISGDLKAIRAGWAAERQRDIAELQAADLAACDADERTWRAEWARLTPDLRGVPAAQVPTILQQTLTARLAVYATIESIARRRARLLGLDAPTRMNWTVSIAEEIAALAAELGVPVADVEREAAPIWAAIRASEARR